MNRYFILICAALVALLVTTAGTTSAEIIETQTFDTEASAAAAGWTGYLNRNYGTTYKTDFGWSNSNNAGGVAGEAGGDVPSKTTAVAYYADTTIGTLSQTNSLSASGKIQLNEASGAGGAMFFGWFDKGNLVTGVPTELIGIIFFDPSPDPEMRWGAIGGGAFDQQTGSNGMVKDTDYTFDLSYDPTGGAAVGDGRVTVSLYKPDTTLLATSTVDFNSTGAAYNLNAFGIRTYGVGSERQEFVFYTDDLSYAVPEPSTLALLTCGLIGLLCYAWRKRK